MAGGSSISAGSVLRGGLTFFESEKDLIDEFWGGDVADAAADRGFSLSESDDAYRRLI